MKIKEQMNTLRLHGMSTLWDSLTESRQHLQLDLHDGLELLLQAEKEERQQRRTTRLIYQARFRYQASMEEISFDPSRKLDKSRILSLSDCQYITQGQSVVITGPTGAGKSFLASALGHQACLMGYSTAYYNVQRLLNLLKMAKVDGSIFKVERRLYKTQLLILDDFGLQTLNDKQRLDFLDIIEDRHGRKSTIIVSQIPMVNWFDVIADNTIADAIVDRFIHQSIKIEMKGESLRKKR
jgi:DNA replication protein DnaC